MLVLTLCNHIMIFGGMNGKLHSKVAFWRGISCAEGGNDEMVFQTLNAHFKQRKQVYKQEFLALKRISLIKKKEIQSLGCIRKTTRMLCEILNNYEKKHSHRINVSLYFSLINGQRQKFYLYTCFFFYFFSILNPSKSLFVSVKCVFNRNFMLKACSSVHPLSCHRTKVLNSRAEAI